MKYDQDGLAWRGVEATNPWWTTGAVPPERTNPLHRHAFAEVYQATRKAEPGRGVVLLGPRRVGKSVLLHQVAAQLLTDGVPATDICLLSLDDVALRSMDLGHLMDLVDARLPLPPGRTRHLLLDEVQHSPEWSGWLKRLADQRHPVRFLATGSSATALRHGGQDAGLGRWREMTLFPWSFREHIALVGDRSPIRFALDRLHEVLGEEATMQLRLPLIDAHLASSFEAVFVDYLLRGGFPEAAVANDLREARRRLRQDILDRMLGRDILDVESADPRILERMFLRICLDPGGLWNESAVAGALGVSRPTVSKYLLLLERAFLVFRLENLASPIRGQPKVYLVSPALRQALLGLEPRDVEHPEQWGPLAENAVVAAAVGSRPGASQIGFWRKGGDEVDLVIIEGSRGEFIEVKRGGRRRAAEGPLRRAMEALGVDGDARVLSGPGGHQSEARPWGTLTEEPASFWLYRQSASSGGTLRLRL